MKDSLISSKGPVYVGWDQGPREYQEDYFGVFGKGNRTLMVAADGMGGHSRGDLASRWVVEALVQVFKEKKDVEEIFGEGIQRAMNKIRESGKDMGCTMAAAVIEKEGERYRLSYTWVGDSRVYLMGGVEKPSDNAKKIDEINDRHLWILTDDDSFVWGFYLNDELTLDQVTQHPSKNQLELSLHSKQENAADVVKKRIRTLYLKENDKLFLCTDGIWETYPSQAEIMVHINEPNPHAAVQNHLKKAREEGTFSDNGTFILAEMKTEIFNRRYFPPKKGLKRKISSFYAALIAVIVFALLFFILIGKFDSIFEKFKGKKSETVKVGSVEKVEKKSGEPKEKAQEVFQQPRIPPAVPRNKSEEKVIDRGDGSKKESVKKSTYYSIRVGAFREVANARKLREKYRKMDYPVRVIPPGKYKNNKYYLVMVGEFPDKNEAKKEKGKLEKKAKETFYIERFQ